MPVRAITPPWDNGWMIEQILSPREKQLLRRLAAGKTDREIALKLGGTVQQISNQRARLLGRLRIASETEIAEAAQGLAEWRKYRGIT